MPTLSDSDFIWQGNDRTYNELLAEASAREGIPVELAKAIHSRGEAYTPANNTSPKGATGPMQLMPGTFKEMAGELGFEKPDINNAEQNIAAGVHYLKLQLDKFKKPELAIAAYNSGPGAVQKYGGIPPYKETTSYTKRVLDALSPQTVEAATTVATPTQVPQAQSKSLPKGFIDVSQLPDEHFEWYTPPKGFLNKWKDLREEGKAAMDASPIPGPSYKEDFIIPGLARGTGIAAGFLNASKAFEDGLFDYAEKTKGKPVSPSESVIGSTLAGLKSAWDSATKEGSWGAGGDSFDKYVFGKTVDEAYPDASPALKTTYQIIRDTALDPMTWATLGLYGVGKTGVKIAGQFLDPAIAAALKATGRTPQMVGAKFTDEMLSKVLADSKVADTEINRLELRDSLAKVQESPIVQTAKPVVEKASLGQPKPWEPTPNKLEGIVPVQPEVAPEAQRIIDMARGAARPEPVRVPAPLTPVEPAVPNFQPTATGVGQPLLRPATEGIQARLPAPLVTERPTTTPPEAMQRIMAIIEERKANVPKLVPEPAQVAPSVQEQIMPKVAPEPVVAPRPVTVPPPEQIVQQAKPALAPKITVPDIPPERIPHGTPGSQVEKHHLINGETMGEIENKFLSGTKAELDESLAGAVEARTAKDLEQGVKDYEDWLSPGKLPGRVFKDLVSEGWSVKDANLEVAKREARYKDAYEKSLIEPILGEGKPAEKLKRLEDMIYNNEALGKPIPQSHLDKLEELKGQVSAKEVTNLGSINYTQAKKSPDGTWKLFYRGTRNEVFPGEKFSTQAEAKQYFKVQKVKEQEANLTNPLKSESGAIRLPGMQDPVDAKFKEIMKTNPYYKRINEMVAEPTKKSGLLTKDGLKDSFEAFKVEMLDRFDPLKKDLPKTYEKARKISSTKDIAAIDFNELKTAMAPVKDHFDAFQKYVLASRAETRAGIWKESPKNVPGAVKVSEDKWMFQIENPGGVTKAEAIRAKQEILDAYKQAGGNPQELVDAAKAWNEWTQKNILGRLHDAEIISDEAYKAVLKSNDFYATFRIMHYLPEELTDVATTLRSKEYFSVANQDVLRGLKGTTKQTTDPVEATLGKYLDTVYISERNKVTSTFVDEMRSNPSSPVRDMIRPIAKSDKEMGQMRAAGLNPFMEGSMDPKEWTSISRFKKGEVETYAVAKDLGDTMKGLSSVAAPKVITAMNNVFRKAATSVYLPFTISNAMRDAFMAFTTSKAYKTTEMIGRFQLDWLKGLKEGVKHEFFGNSAAVQDYIKSGGGMGWVGEMRTSKLAKQSIFPGEKTLAQKGATLLKSPLDLIEKISSSIELAPRLAVFEKAKSMKMSAEEAAMLARESTIDFAKAGTKTRILNSWVPFLNARVQGRLQSWNAVATGSRADKINSLSKMFTGVLLPSAATYAYNQTYYPELYKDIPDYIKKNYYCLITGTDKDERGKTVPKYFVLAKGDIGQMLSNPLEYALDEQLRKNKSGLTGFLVDTVLSDMSPVDLAREGKPSIEKAFGSLLPPVVKGVVEGVANKSFYTGQAIESIDMMKKQPELRYKKNTPEVYKWLSKNVTSKLPIPFVDTLINSPVKLQNTMSNLLAGYGREGLSPTEMGKGFLGRFEKSRGGAQENKAWDVYEGIKQDYDHLRASAEELVKDGNRKDAIKMLTEWNKGLKGRVSEMDEFGFKDKGGMMTAFFFTAPKIKNVLVSNIESPLSPLERRLRGRKGL